MPIIPVQLFSFSLSGNFACGEENGESYFLITASLSSLLVSTLAASATGFYQIDLVKYPQEKSNWCWAACAQMSGKHEYPSSTRNQTNIVTHIKSIDSNSSATAEETALAAEYACYNVSDYNCSNGTLPSEFFFSQLVSDNVPIAGLYPTSTLDQLLYGGHMVILNTIATNDTTTYFSYYDLAQDCQVTMDVNSFYNGSSEGYSYVTTCYTYD